MAWSLGSVHRTGASCSPFSPQIDNNQEGCSSWVVQRTSQRSGCTSSPIAVASQCTSDMAGPSTRSAQRWQAWQRSSQGSHRASQLRFGHDASTEAESRHRSLQRVSRSAQCESLGYSSQKSGVVDPLGSSPHAPTPIRSATKPKSAERGCRLVLIPPPCSAYLCCALGLRVLNIAIGGLGTAFVHVDNHDRDIIASTFIERKFNELFDGLHAIHGGVHQNCADLVFCDQIAKSVRAE